MSTPWAALLLYVSLATAYSVLVPIFEAPDEPAHLDYLNSLLLHDRLPEHERTAQAHQPPAYYALLALALHRPFHDGIEVQVPANPDFDWTGPRKNLYLHPPKPWFSLGPRSVFFHQLRALQIVLGAISVLFAWKLARLLAPSDPKVAWLSAMLAAGMPQFLFISSSLSNSNVTNALSAATLFSMARLHRQPKFSLRSSFAVGALIGLSLLGKLTAAFLVPTWILICALAPMTRPERALRAAAGAAAALAVSGWFYAWNLVRFGNFVGERIVFQWGVAGKVLDFDYWYFLFRSFWGRFGWLNVKAPLPVYLLFYAISLAAAAGLVISLVRYRRRALPPALIVTAAAVGFQLLLIPPFSLGYDAFLQPQGRYLFAALGAVTFLMAVGMRSAARPKTWAPLSLWGIPAAMIVTNLLVLAFAIYPAYYV